MIKKLFAAVAGVGIFLTAATPAFAVTPTLDIVNNADIVNQITTMASTGWNTIDSILGGVFGKTISTGAAGAKTEVTNAVNANTINSASNTTINNSTTVTNAIDTSAFTDWNIIISGPSEQSDPTMMSSIVTGTGVSQSVINNVVNTNVVGL